MNENEARAWHTVARHFSGTEATTTIEALDAAVETLATAAQEATGSGYSPTSTVSRFRKLSARKKGASCDCA